MNRKYKKIGGWLFFLMAIGLFSVQMGYFFIKSRYVIEYVDNRFFYVINILIVLAIFLSLFLLLAVNKKWKMIIVSITVVILFIQGVFITIHSYQTKHILRISPDFKNVVVIKEDRKAKQAKNYRSYYWIFAREKEILPYKTKSEFKVKWVEKDIAAVTYKSADSKIHQYIGTYGGRDEGSYSYVGPSIAGQWQGDNAMVISSPDGITVVHNGKTEKFKWDSVVQFGTLAVVLVQNNEATWMIGLSENFNSNSNELIPPSGEIVLYEATMNNNDPITLKYLSVE
jgi:hypothetical protein